ncbi:MAG: Cys-Gln thioester bond-forming surface protein, partial [Oscillospiraceae bacterium]|nr:Cys-Gln thioester bond-forming surface protein [Oscillospiraceae bacterium]
MNGQRKHTETAKLKVKKLSKQLVAILVVLMLLITAMPSGLLGMLVSAWEWAPTLKVYGRENGYVGSYRYQKYPNSAGDPYYAYYNASTGTYSTYLNRNVLQYVSSGIGGVRLRGNGTTIELIGHYGMALTRSDAVNNVNIKEVYCIESGISFDGYASADVDKGTTYDIKNPGDSWYWNALPAGVREGILRALLYGYSEGKTGMPNLGGTPSVDMKAATQVLIWEIQQQIHLTSTGGGLDAMSWDPDYRRDFEYGGARLYGGRYFDSIRGTAAEPYYRYIMLLCSQHDTGFSFSYPTAAQAQANSNILNRQSDGTYKVVLEETNGIELPLGVVSGTGINVSRTGVRGHYTYTFTSNSPIPDGVTLTLRKDVGRANNDPPYILQTSNSSGRVVGTDDHYQTMAQGAIDDKFWYVSFKTEEGAGEIEKAADGGTRAGFTFDFYGPLSNGPTHHYITTDANGAAAVDHLPVGTYDVTETAAPNSDFKKPPTQTVEVRANETTTVSFYNEWKDGKL